MTTTVKAAARWTGGSFAVGDGDIPHWLAAAMGAAKLTFDPPSMGVETTDGPVSGAEGDWLVLLDDDSLAVVTDDDFTADYQIEGA